MPYVALEFDHKIAQPEIRLIVVSCSGVGNKCGGPIALSPRYDVAYFLNAETAKDDALRFAKFKNSSDSLDTSILSRIKNNEVPRAHYAYAWDHKIHSNALLFGVLQWSGIQGAASMRTDVAYFVDPESAETDANFFAFQRDLLVPAP